MPHEVYNFVLERCFDACIVDLKHKSLGRAETECLNSCANNLKQNPVVYQKMH